MSQIEDITGLRSGQLVVIEFSHIGPGRNAVWLCQCDCGKTKLVHARSLKNGHASSCGCSRKTHGLSRTKEWCAWQSMRSRCYNPLHKNYGRYGGRGIVVYDKWRTSFEKFLDYMGKAPPKTSLDRIDNNGNYEPKNCRWATSAQQNQNTRNSIGGPYLTQEQIDNLKHSFKIKGY